MQNIVTILDPKKVDIKQEMLNVNVHGTGIDIMSSKAEFLVVKIKDVPVVAANIIKQNMLSFGGEAATAAGTINHSIKTTDVLIFGTLQQIQLLSEKLKLQYFGLKEISIYIKNAILNYRADPKPIKIGNKTFKFGQRTYIMGILNVTPDSFSDGGRYFDADKAVEHARAMAKEGADIIDIGGESTKPGAKNVSIKEELSRIIPIIKEVAKIKNMIVSIDTTKSEVADKAILAGAKMINDISGLNFDPRIAKVAAKRKVPLILMHIKGSPRNMQKDPKYCDLLPEIISYLQNSIRIAIRDGVPGHNIIVDPGFGFGKLPEHNLEMLRNLRQLKVLGCPIMIGTSRKSTIGSVLGLPVDQRFEGTAATVASAVAEGADIIRVHDVASMSKVAKMSDAIYRHARRW